MKRLLKFLRLPPDDRRILAQALIILPLTPLTLRLMGLRRSQRAFSYFLPHSPAQKTKQPTLTRALHISQLINLAARRGICSATCLQRSLALWWLLRQEGMRSELYIGTRKVAGKLDAHAWIEIDGVVLNDSSDVRHRYEPFDREILHQVSGGQ